MKNNLQNTPFWNQKANRKTLRMVYPLRWDALISPRVSSWPNFCLLVSFGSFSVRRSRDLDSRWLNFGIISFWILHFWKTKKERPSQNGCWRINFDRLTKFQTEISIGFSKNSQIFLMLPSITRKPNLTTGKGLLTVFTNKKDWYLKAVLLGKTSRDKFFVLWSHLISGFLKSPPRHLVSGFLKIPRSDSHLIFRISKMETLNSSIVVKPQTHLFKRSIINHCFTYQFETISFFFNFLFLDAINKT